jgi:hypothetical protein
MKKLLFFILIGFIMPLQNFGQQVENIQFHKEGDNIIITYDLKGGESYCYNIEAYYSTNGGETYQLIESAEGDIGRGVPDGKNKKIVWNALEDTYGLMGNVQFKIVAGKAETEDYFKIGYTMIPDDDIFTGGLSISYGWSCPLKRTGWLLSGNYDMYRYRFNDSRDYYEYKYYELDIGLIYKLVNRKNFGMSLYGQLGLSLRSVYYGCDIRDSQSYEEWQGDLNSFRFIFPVNIGTILSINNFNLMMGMKIYDNSTGKIKNLDGYESDFGLPPKNELGFSLGYVWIF